jgi:hypothetical protein
MQFSTLGDSSFFYLERKASKTQWKEVVQDREKP